MFARASSLGLALVVISLVPVALLAATAAARRGQKMVKRSARQTRQDQRAQIERLRGLDVESEADRRRAYDDISSAVRGYAAERANVPARGLTAGELDAAIAGNSRLPRESLIALLAACDSARYAPDGALPPAAACREALRDAEQVLAGR